MLITITENRIINNAFDTIRKKEDIRQTLISTLDKFHKLCNTSNMGDFLKCTGKMFVASEKYMYPPERIDNKNLVGYLAKMSKYSDTWDNYSYLIVYDTPDNKSNDIVPNQMFRDSLGYYGSGDQLYVEWNGDSSIPYIQLVNTLYAKTDESITYTMNTGLYSKEVMIERFENTKDKLDLLFADSVLEFLQSI